MIRRFVTAASLFDGHDASINIIRRMLQASGAEVIHLGHNRSVKEIVDAAIEEDVHGIAVSSYQGGHVEFFRYMVDMLGERGAADKKVFAGGGGVIVPSEIEALESYGVERIYSPEDGQQLGLEGMIDDMIARAGAGCAESNVEAILEADGLSEALAANGWGPLARLLTAIENGGIGRSLPAREPAPVLGITGTGGSGKSSLTDELVRRFRTGHGSDFRIGILAVDPTRRRTGGALLGDRIRMNAIHADSVFVRSVATRNAQGEVPDYLPDMAAAMQLARFDLVIVETPGIGQGDAGIVSLADLSLYVMTPEYGAASQLEKIDMLDFADVVVINKFDRHGADDAYRDVCKQVQRNREDFATEATAMPVFGTISSRFNDDGVTALYGELMRQLAPMGVASGTRLIEPLDIRCSSKASAIIPARSRGYLGEIAGTVRTYRSQVDAQAASVRELQHLEAAHEAVTAAGKDTGDLSDLVDEAKGRLDSATNELLAAWDGRQRADDSGYFETQSGTALPKVAWPSYHDRGDVLRWLMLENVPGSFPFTAGVFPSKRQDEDPTRMFAGEGAPERTNSRFKALSSHSEAKRLSTAFDSVTLYGCDPDRRPDIYGKVGNSGVSVATLDDVKVLYDGFDLCDPATSVSMTINGPAPAVLAMFLATAVDQARARFEEETGKAPTAAEAEDIRRRTLENVRGTVQADILKEDQGQNTCIFSTEFALKLMADIQEYFVRNRVRRFYSVSISGYHIAEAGANPITQLAFTLANGFTYVEAYLARGMEIDDFAPNLSFFFSNGMDPEYSVLGRVARRIWAVAMRERYGADERSQKLKYHIQTSGRSLHAQEMAFNDIRTTLQALIAVYDNCNSLHTNAFDEAITTPTEESVRRALAIQLIINREWGLAKNENPLQGSFVIEELTDLVEEAVLTEFENISARGGVLGAMEKGYQRGKIQDESLLYERRKHDGSLPIVGVNTFLNPAPAAPGPVELTRATEKEKASQLARLEAFQKRHETEARAMLARLRETAAAGENVFAVLVDAVRCCSLGQLTSALYEVGGEYRRNM